MSTKRRIAWFSPVATTTGSVSAYATSQLVPLLSEHFEIELFTDEIAELSRPGVYHYLSAFARHRDRPFDHFFYQYEDSRATRFVRSHLGLIPGIVWFHDILISDDGPEGLFSSPWRETLKLYYGETSRFAGREERFDKEGPYAYREGALAAVALFSSERDHEEFSRLKLGALCESHHALLPHPIPGRATRNRVHGSVIGFCGSPRIEHRAHKLLQALAELKGMWSLVWLVAPNEKPQAEALIREFGITKVTIVEGRSPQAWQELLAEIDVAAHLQFSAFGHPGVYLASSLMAGVPSLVTDYGDGEHVPRDIAFFIEAGEREATWIKETLSHLSLHEMGSRMSCSGSSCGYASERFDSRVVASELSSIFECEAAYVAEVMSRWSEMREKGRIELRRELESLVTIDHFPGVGPDEVFSQVCARAFKELGIL